MEKALQRETVSQPFTILHFSLFSLKARPKLRQLAPLGDTMPLRLLSADVRVLGQAKAQTAAARTQETKPPAAKVLLASLGLSALKDA